MTLEWAFNRGDTIAIPYVILEGFSDIASVEAHLKLSINPDQPIVPPEQPLIVPMTLVPIAPNTGWYVGLSAEQSAALPPDLYATQIRMTLVGGDVVHGDPLLVRINEPVTEEG